jgi:hypothetical protein
MPFFLHFNPEFLIRTLPGCVSTDRPDQFPTPITADDYLQERLREIQAALKASATTPRRRLPVRNKKKNEPMLMLYLQALLGIAVFVALALPLSSNVAPHHWKLVGVAVALQFVICALLLKVPLLSQAFAYVNRAVDALGRDAQGTSFVYGYVGGAAPPFTVTDPVPR